MGRLGRPARLWLAAWLLLVLVPALLVPALLVPALLVPALPARAGPAESNAQDPGTALRQVEQGIASERARGQALTHQSDQLAGELGKLRARLMALAEQTRDNEAALADLEAKLTILTDQERQQTAALDAGRTRIGKLLGALERLARTPPEALALRPGTPIDTMRSALLLGSAVPELKRQTEGLKAALAELARLRGAIAERQAQAEAKRAELAHQDQDMRALIVERQSLQHQTDADRRAAALKLAQLTSQAHDLRALMARLEAEREAREAEARRQAEAAARAAEERAAEERAAAAAPATAAPAVPSGQRLAAMVPAPPPSRIGHLLLPVLGTVTTRYGDADRFGEVSHGLTIAARPGATVVSPFDGSVMFAGPFRGYGLILILEHPNGYHSLIAGLGRIDTRVGQQALAGEPVGTMPTPENGNPDLYFELRRNGQPINPQDGIAGDGRGQG